MKYMFRTKNNLVAINALILLWFPVGLVISYLRMRGFFDLSDTFRILFGTMFVLLFLIALFKCPRCGLRSGLLPSFMFGRKKPVYYLFLTPPDKRCRRCEYEYK